MTNFYYKLKISYAGQNYFGWQIQKDTDLTIQGQLNIALCGATGLNDFKLIASGRTDAGVHALGQVVLVKSAKKLPSRVFLKGVNQRLPKDIKIISVDEVDEKFHPIYDSKSKTYEYVLSLKEMDPFLSHYSYHYCASIDLDLLRVGADCFKGEQDFVNYFCVGTEMSSTVRTIFHAEVFKASSLSLGNQSIIGDFICIRFIGSGFLKQQVRLMVGALLALNEHKVSTLDIRDSLLSRKNRHLGAVAPACGLYLKDVFY